MIGTIRKHQTWLWAVIIAGTIISFVIFFSPDARWNWGDRASDVYVSFTSGKPVPLYGKSVGREEFENAYQEALLGYLIRSGGRLPDNDEQFKENLERETLNRLLLIKRIQDLEIHVSPEAVARVARERIGDYPYGKFVSDILAPAGLDRADFERYALHEAGIQQLAAVAAVSANLVNSREAEALYRQDHEEVAVEVAVFWATNYLDQVIVVTNELQTFFTNRTALYREPEKVQVSYVEFPAADSNYLAEADKLIALQTNLPAFIQEEYYRRGTNVFKDTNGVVLSEAAAKEQIKEEVRVQMALIEARKHASQFGTVLSEKEPVNRVENLAELAAEKGLPLKVSPPFDYAKGLEGTDLPEAFRSAGLRLNRENPIRFSPVVGSNAVYVLALNTILPSVAPTYELVQDRVALDYKQSHALTLARAAGTNFFHALTNGLAQGKTFAELSSQHKVKTVPLPPFSTSTRSLTNVDERIRLELVKQHALDLKKGEVSEFVLAAEGGMIVYVRDRLPFDEAKVKTEMPEFVANLRYARFVDSFNRWFREQAKDAQLVPPQKPEVTGAPRRRP